MPDINPEKRDKTQEAVAVLVLVLEFPAALAPASRFVSWHNNLAITRRSMNRTRTQRLTRKWIRTPHSGLSI